MASPSSRGRRQQPAAASFVSQDVHAGTTRFPTPVGTPSCSRSPSPSHSESTQSLMDALTRTVREPIWMHPLGWRTEQLSLLRVSILDDGAPPVPSMGSSLPPGCVPSWWNSRLEAAVELGMSIEVLHRMLVQSVLCMFQTRERPWFQMPESSKKRALWFKFGAYQARTTPLKLMVRREEHAAGVVAVPFLAFLDGEHTAQLREHQFGGHHTTGMSRRSFAYKYATLPLDPYYVAMLLAMAQAQSELLPPDTAVFTVRLLCPGAGGDLALLTATVPASYLACLADPHLALHDTLSIQKSVIPLTYSLEELLNAMHGLLDAAQALPLHHLLTLPSGQTLDDLVDALDAATLSALAAKPKLQSYYHHHQQHIRAIVGKSDVVTENYIMHHSPGRESGCNCLNCPTHAAAAYMMTPPETPAPLRVPWKFRIKLGRTKYRSDEADNEAETTEQEPEEEEEDNEEAEEGEEEEGEGDEDKENTPPQLFWAPGTDLLSDALSTDLLEPRQPLADNVPSRIFSAPPRKVGSVLGWRRRRVALSELFPGVCGTRATAATSTPGATRATAAATPTPIVPIPVKSGDNVCGGGKGGCSVSNSHQNGGGIIKVLDENVGAGTPATTTATTKKGSIAARALKSLSFSSLRAMFRSASGSNRI